MAINREWHESHRMPPNATLDERVRWHMEHLAHCDCRHDLPPKIAAEIARRAGAGEPQPGD